MDLSPGTTMQTAGAILASPFRMVGSAASSMLPMFSPARLFSAKKAPLGDSSNDRSNQAVPAQLDVLDSASKRKVQITKAFTQLRSDLSTEGAESLAPVKRSSPAKKKRGSAQRIGVRKSIDKTKSPAKVKTEPMRRSRRNRAYKKGSMCEQRLTKAAWSGKGTASDPITC